MSNEVAAAAITRADAMPEPEPGTKPKVAREVAEREFERMCSARRIKTTLVGLTKDEISSFENIKGTFVEGMMRGEIKVTTAGDPTFTPAGGKTLTFHRATGATLMAGDGLGEHAHIERMVAIATAMTKEPPGAIAALDLVDFRIVSDITNLFLARR